MKIVVAIALIWLATGLARLTKRIFDQLEQNYWDRRRRD